MAGHELESIERRLLAHLQRDFPLVPRPYQKLAEDLDIAEGDVLALIRGFKDKGLVRQIGPVIDARRLGYQSTLVASEVPGHDLDRAQAMLIEHPGISHAYERDNTLNIWFTLSVSAGTDIESEARNLGSGMRARQVFSLPAVRLFKIGAFFRTEEMESTGHLGTEMPQKVTLSGEERAVVNTLQGDLPLTLSPFDEMAEESGMTTVEFLSHCRSLIDRGIVRRFGASVNHRKAGYEGNGMACWRMPRESVESAGRQLAAIGAVSHCYERRTNPSWRYNLFAMFHSDNREACRAVVEDASERLGMSDWLVLFSNREIRKTRVKYLA